MYEVTHSYIYAAFCPEPLLLLLHVLFSWNVICHTYFNQHSHSTVFLEFLSVDVMTIFTLLLNKYLLSTHMSYSEDILIKKT